MKAEVAGTTSAPADAALVPRPGFDGPLRTGGRSGNRAGRGGGWWACCYQLSKKSSKERDSSGSDRAGYAKTTGGARACSVPYFYSVFARFSASLLLHLAQRVLLSHITPSFCGVHFQCPPMKSIVDELLLSRRWGDLSRHFESFQPNCANGFVARALSQIFGNLCEVDWNSVVADLREASRIKSGDFLLSANLTQALMDSRQYSEAFETAQSTFQMHPRSLIAAETLVAAAVAMQRWPVAYQTLLQAKNTICKNRELPERAVNTYRELSTQWWVPIEVANLVLRQPQESDASYFANVFRNQEFMMHYHRFQGSSDQAIASFIADANSSPYQTRRMDWIIFDEKNNRIGLAAIVDIDWGNARGELLIGMPKNKSPTAALKASVGVLDFAFNRFKLGKVVSYVYADNPVAQANTLHLGFLQEGVLRSHIAVDNGRMDLFVNGMTSADFTSYTLLRSLARRWAPAFDQSAQTLSVHNGMNDMPGDNGTDGAVIRLTAPTGGVYYLGANSASSQRVSFAQSYGYVLPSSFTLNQHRPAKRGN